MSTNVDPKMIESEGLVDDYGILTKIKAYNKNVDEDFNLDIENCDIDTKMKDMLHADVGNTIHKNFGHFLESNNDDGDRTNELKHECEYDQAVKKVDNQLMNKMRMLDKQQDVHMENKNPCS